MAKKSKANDDLQQKIDELTADLQRVHADFVNFRRRNDEERQQLSGYAKITVVTTLLPLIDNLERAFTHLPAELKDNQWAKGVVQLHKQFQTSLKELGVERIEAKGQPFDPHLHEAATYDDEGGEEEVVAEELQAGYKLDDQVIRHSVVKVKK